MVVDSSGQSISRVQTNSKHVVPTHWLCLSQDLFESEWMFIMLCHNGTEISAHSCAVHASPVLESAMVVPDSDAINESGLFGDFAVSEVLCHGTDGTLSELLFSPLLELSTILKRSILQPLTPVLEITLRITDSGFLSDESVSHLEISAQVDSAISSFAGPLPTENGKKSRKIGLWLLLLVWGLVYSSFL
jgi:hypothetical protein